MPMSNMYSQTDSTSLLIKGEQETKAIQILCSLNLVEKFFILFLLLIFMLATMHSERKSHS